jgi:hypothetical protein
MNLIALLLIGLSVADNADVITDWNEKAVVRAGQTLPFVQTRSVAIVHLAMFDAINSDEKRMICSFVS